MRISNSTHQKNIIIGLFYFICACCIILILRNLILLSRDMVYGDLSARKLFPSPRYEILRIPDKVFSRLYNAQGRLTADFAQIYFPSQQMDSLSENYQIGAHEIYDRPSRYAPLIHYICSISICRMDYGPASFLHVAIQYILFLIVFIASFKYLNIEKDILPGLLIANACLFLTRAGLSFFERGQFSLYVGIGYLLIIVGIIKRKHLLILCSALFAFIKWTSFPLFLIIFLILIFGSKKLAEFKRTILLGASFLLILLILLFTFPEQSLYFLKGLYIQEQLTIPRGISLAQVLPVSISKYLPIPLIMLGAWVVKINNRYFERAIPFLAGSAVVLLTYPTIAYEYNLPSLLGFIPLMIYWTRLPNSDDHERVWKALKYTFYVFLLVTSQLAIPAVVFIEYMLISSILIMVPMLYRYKTPWSPE